MKPTASKQIESKYDQIEMVMIENPNYRHNDNCICTEIWENELAKMKSHDGFFFMYYSSGKITSADSITRCARMIRKKHGWKKDKTSEIAKVKKVVKKLK
jgi:hypothetical protein